MSKKEYQYRFGGPFNWIIAIGALILVFYIFTQLIKILWWLAAMLMPVLLIATFIINRSVLFNYVKMIRNLYKKNTTTGIIATVLSVIASPLVILGLFGQAMVLRKINKVNPQQQKADKNKFGEYIEYEEVNEQFKNLLNEVPREKPRIELRQPPKEDPNPYDELWK